jgi:hypothetical protein
VKESIPNWERPCNCQQQGSLFTVEQLHQGFEAKALHKSPLGLCGVALFCMHCIRICIFCTW